MTGILSLAPSDVLGQDAKEPNVDILPFTELSDAFDEEESPLDAAADGDDYDASSSVNEDDGTDLLPENAGVFSPLFYDARIVGLSKDLSKSLFEGDVVAIGGGVMITADRIEVDKSNQTTGELRAIGHVVILTPEQVFAGDEVVFNWATGDFKITNAIMLSYDEQEVRKISDRILGFTPQEVEFEIERKKRLENIEAQKEELRKSFRLGTRVGQKPSQQMLDRYALLLEQEELTRTQENSALLKMDSRRKKSYLKRREFWEKSKQDFLSKGKSDVPSTYLRITGDTLTRINVNDYEALNATFTPCKCADDELPAWGFQADTIRAQNGGYIDFVHPVLRIKGLPVLYMPILKLPLKNQRQSGFLVPTLRTGDAKMGTVFTQPVFFDLGRNFDATMTTDIFEKRGTRLGLETRYEHREYSRWSFKFETIRDSVWLEERNTRERLLEYNLDPRHSACPVTDPNGNAIDPTLVMECENRQRSYLAVPKNSWRGTQEWQGRHFFSPRTSFVSKGVLQSDHRYVEDLYMTDEFTEAFSPSQSANVFSTAKSRLHIDQSNYYLGVGSSIGDYVFADQRFQGLQLPAHLSFKSRMFNLNGLNIIPTTVYAQVSTTHYQIQEIFGNQTYAADETNALRGGRWQRFAVDLVSPLITRGPVSVDYFGDVESRYIKHEGLSHKTSYVQSWRSGVTFNLPLDGTGELPGFLQPDDWEKRDHGKRHIHHLMNWALTFSTRPVVVRRGAYEDPTQFRGPPKVYFASDRKEFIAEDDAVTVEESMLRHQRVTFSTNHRWKSYRKAWQLIPGIEKPEEIKPSETYHERALRELMFSIDKPISRIDEMISEANGLNWYINRYQLNRRDMIEPVNFDGKVSFDFVQEERRKEEIRRNRVIEADPLADQDAIVKYDQLPEAWTGPETNLAVNWAGYTLSNHVVYNLYKRYSTKVSFNLGLPPFFNTTLAVGYTLEKKPEYDALKDVSLARRTHVRSATIGTRLIPYINTTISLVKNSVEGQDDQYETRVGLEYYSPSECWGLRFLRSKNLNQNEEDASYLLQLSIIFAGVQRPQDISPQLGRVIRP